MRKIVLLFFLITASFAVPQTSGGVTVVTDPAQITSKQKFDIQPFTIEKLYMTHTIGDSSWSPDDKQVAFVTNISGRNNIWIVSVQSGWAHPHSANNSS